MGFLVTAVALFGCGKKGPPLAPIVHIPAAVDKLAARRIGNDVYLTVIIPTQNIDSSTPADVSRIDIFATTTLTPPPRPRIFEIASKVASIDVAPATQPGQSADDGAARSAAASPQLPAQGATVTIRDALTPSELVPKELSAAPAPDRGMAVATTAPAVESPSFPRRIYVAVATSDRGRSGPPGVLLDVPLFPLPDPPGPLTFAPPTQDSVSFSWEPSGGVIGFLLETPAAPESAPVDEAPSLDALPGVPAAPVLAGGPTMYNVYRELPPEDAGAPQPTAAAWDAVPPAPINPTPLATLTYTDSADMQLGRQRCYTVRAVRGVAPNLVIGLPSERGCITPEDLFPPAAPTGLNAIAAEGVISLLWEPNGEADLGGYLVLRGRAGDATLQPLTATPIMDLRYADREVMPGVRYVYAVVAVDTHQPTANVSAESNRAEETAR